MMVERNSIPPKLNDWSTTSSDHFRTSEAIEQMKIYPTDNQANESVERRNHTNILRSILILQISFYAPTSEMLDIDVAVSSRFSVRYPHQWNSFGCYTYIMDYITTANYNNTIDDKWYVGCMWR